MGACVSEPDSHLGGARSLLIYLLYSTPLLYEAADFTATLAASRPAAGSLSAVADKFQAGTKTGDADGEGGVPRVERHEGDG